MHRKGLALLVTGLIALVATAAAGARHSTTVLNGAGSTFVSPLVSVWTPALGSAFDYTIQYSAIGSGGGIQAITNRSVDFGASDAPLTANQFTACNGCVQIPWALAGTSIPYNIPGLVVPKNTNLNLSGSVIAKIYMGTITNWDDPAIKALNPKATIPSLAITPVYRTGNSGTTYNFTDYLSSVSPSWQSNIGTGQSVNWPTGTGASGSAGVAGVVQNTPGALCYVDTAFALANHLHFASIENAAGKFIDSEHQEHRSGRRHDHERAVRERVAHREPAGEVSDGVSDRHLHLHHPASEVGERRRASQDGVLGTDHGPAGEVHSEAVVRTDPQGCPRGIREDARPDPAEYVNPPSLMSGVHEGRRKAPLVSFASTRRGTRSGSRGPCRARRVPRPCHPRPRRRA